jgi:hypothetical protein
MISKVLEGFRKRHRNMFGIPGVRGHKPTVFTLPIVDIVATFAGSGLISYTFETNFVATVACFFVFGQLCHWIFGVNTRLFNRMGIKFKE